MSLKNQLFIYDYSEKSIAVFGNTDDHKDFFERLGGKFNRNLKKDGEITPGWVFVKYRKNDINSYIQSIKCSPLTRAELPAVPIGELPCSNTVTYDRYKSNRLNNTDIINDQSIIQRLERLEILENNIIQRLEKLEKLELHNVNSSLQKVSSDPSHCLDFYQDNENDCINPSRRLLPSKKKLI